MLDRSGVAELAGGTAIAPNFAPSAAAVVTATETAAGLGYA